MQKLLEKYRKFVDVVRTEHEKRSMASGHDFDHAFAVANLAYIFCEEETSKEAAWISGLSHNADRMLQHDRKLSRREVPAEDVEKLVRGWMSVYSFSEEVMRVVVNATVNHSNPNDESDDMVIIALKDADRVVNARIDVVIRSGQFQSYLPILEPTLLLEDKRGRYNERPTIMADLLDCLDWGNLEDARFGVRTAGAKRMIVKRVALLKQFLETIVEQRREEGLVPYPV